MPIPITAITGVGEKRAALFKKLGAETLEQLVRIYPRDYRDFSKISVTAAVDYGDCALRVRVMRPPRVAYPRRGLSIVTVTASDETGNVELVWFNQPYMSKNVEQGQVYLVCGKAIREKSRLRMTNPVLMPGDRTPGIVPIYPLTQGLTQNAIRSAMQAALDKLGETEEPIAEPFLKEYGLMGIDEALRSVHFSKDTATLSRARHRLATEEVVVYVAAMELASANVRKATGASIPTEGLLEAFCQKLPFTLTNAQKRAMEQVAKDISGPFAMNRMVQGDVGSGKTAVAFFCHVCRRQGRGTKRTDGAHGNTGPPALRKGKTAFGGGVFHRTAHRRLHCKRAGTHL